MATKKKPVKKPLKTKVKTQKKKVEETVSPIRYAAEKEKLQADRQGKPWVGVLNTEFDPKNPGAGFFELDWNEAFVAQLLQAGYNGKSEEDVVNQWFEDVCKSVLADSYEEVAQMQGTTFIQRKRTEDGKTEVS